MAATHEENDGSAPIDAHPARARRVAWVAGGLVVLVMIVLVILLLPDVSTNDAQVDAHIPTVSSRVAGYVINVHVNDNQPVKAGKALVDLDPRDYQAAADQAQAAYSVAVADAEEARVNITLTRGTTMSTKEGSVAQRQGSEADLSRTETAYLQSRTASVDEARANLAAKKTLNTRAQTDLRRYTILLATNDVSKLQFDGIESAARVADADLRTAQQQLLAAEESAEIAKAQTSNAESQLKRAQANLRQSIAQQLQVPIRIAAYESARAAAVRAKASLDEALLQLSYTHVVAPVDGQVTQRSVEVGQYVAPGEQLMTVVPLDQVYVTANFKETQLAHVRAGQRVKIQADEYPGTTFWGNVDSIAGSTGARQALLPPQNATGNFVKVVQRIPVKIVVDRRRDGDPVLRPGMNVEATIRVR